MTYAEAIAYLDSFQNYEKHSQYDYNKTLGLERVRELLDKLGNPHQQFKSIHVAGTKGKGTTCYVCASVLQADGLKVGLFTSPHIFDFRERIQVNGEWISEAALTAAVEQIQATQVEGLTYFEAVTAAAFLCFAQAGVDIAVVEVGLGGRLDATNVLIPEVCVITPISLDHMHLLGNTVEQIAAEKAGIIKSNIPVVIANQGDFSITNVLEEKAKQVDARVCHSHEPVLHAWDSTLEGTPCQVVFSSVFTKRMIFKGFLDRVWDDLHLPFIGTHLVDNAQTALAALVQLKKRYPKFKCSEQAVREGFANVRIPGRCQLLDVGFKLLVDGAQNKASARALKQVLKRSFKHKPIHLVLGTASDKDAKGILMELGSFATSITVVPIPSPRSMPLETLLELAKKQVATPLERESLEVVLEGFKHNPPEGVVLVAGSLYLAGDALQWAKAQELTPA